MPDQSDVSRKTFQLDEATIAELHDAIPAAQVTCVEVVQQYIARARAYNGACRLLVTEDGRPVPEAKDTLRATSALRFPTETSKASTLLPDLDQYPGPSL